MSRDADTELMVRLAKGAVAVVGMDKSRTQLDSFCSEQGVCVLSDDEGRMMCAWVCLVMEMEVEVVDSDGRSLVSSVGFASVCAECCSFDVWSFFVPSSSSPSGSALSLAGVML